MSHQTTLDTEIKDLAALESAAEHLGYRVEHNATVQLYERTARHENCTAVHIPGWRYPVAVSDGKIYYDNYEGEWGDVKQLNAFRQRYARDVAVKTAKARGYRVTETTEGGKLKIKVSR